MHTLRTTYEALGLPDFSVAEPRVRDYLASLANYRKNTFPEMPAELRQRVEKQWQDRYADKMAGSGN